MAQQFLEIFYNKSSINALTKKFNISSKELFVHRPILSMWEEGDPLHFMVSKNPTTDKSLPPGSSSLLEFSEELQQLLPSCSIEVRSKELMYFVADDIVDKTAKEWAKKYLDTAISVDALTQASPGEQFVEREKSLKNSETDPQGTFREKTESKVNKKRKTMEGTVTIASDFFSQRKHFSLGQDSNENEHSLTAPGDKSDSSSP